VEEALYSAQICDNEVNTGCLLVNSGDLYLIISLFDECWSDLKSAVQYYIDYIAAAIVIYC